MQSTTRCLALGLAFLAPPLAAQAPARFLGLTHALPTVQSQDLVTCQPLRCAPAGFPSTLLPCAGGTAYDTRTRGTWISNGTRIAKVDTRDQCAYQCPIQPLPSTGVNSYVTGLAYEHRGDRLFVTNSDDAIVTYRVNGCALAPESRCAVTLPPGQMLTGIAVDDVGGRVFWTAASCGIAVTPGGTVSVAPLSDPCQPYCTVTVSGCPTGTPLGPLTGIAYDACTDEVWVTDGRNTVSGRILPIVCQFVPTGCCPNPSAPNEAYVGLCIEPSTEDSVGQPCTNGSCPNCAPRHFLNGDPVLGNLGFSVDAEHLPAHTIGATLFNFGPCDPVGILVPPFCAPLHVAVSPTLLGFSENTGGGAGHCSGSTSLAVSIPPLPSLCGLVLSSQVLGICFSGGGGIGTYASNCLSWMITAS